MAEEGHVFEPTVKFVSKGASKTKEIICTTNSSDNSPLAESILAANDLKNETPGLFDNDENQQILPSCMNIISTVRLQSGLINETSASYLQEMNWSKIAENYDHR